MPGSVRCQMSAADIKEISIATLSLVIRPVSHTPFLTHLLTIGAIDRMEGNSILSSGFIILACGVKKYIQSSNPEIHTFE